MAKPVPTLFMKAPFEIIWGKPEADHELPGSPFDGINVKGNDYASTASNLLELHTMVEDWAFIRFTVFGFELTLDQMLMLSWWESKRPEHWSLAEHADNPRINTMSAREATLATRCGQILRVALGNMQGVVLDAESVPYKNFNN
ncbi:hypothetical protein Peetri_00203 [Pseudomonas phage vB_PpuM-Peetri]